MRQGFKSNHWLDENGNPAGGCTTGNGFTISWQKGLLGRGEARKEPNGAFVEDVIDAVIERIEFYERSRFSCQENRDALAHLHRAAERLDNRTRRRESRQVAGTYQQ